MKNGTINAGKKDPAKIKKLIEIVEQQQYKKINGMIVDGLSARLMLQIYDNVPLQKRSEFAKKPIQEMSSIAWRIYDKLK